MRCLVMFVTVVFFLFSLKLKWPKNKNVYDKATFDILKFILTARIGGHIQKKWIIMLAKVAYWELREYAYLWKKEGIGW